MRLPFENDFAVVVISGLFLSVTDSFWKNNAFVKHSVQVSVWVKWQAKRFLVSENPEIVCLFPETAPVPVVIHFATNLIPDSVLLF